jgi:hypothetical protein
MHHCQEIVVVVALLFEIYYSVKVDIISCVVFYIGAPIDAGFVAFYLGLA